MCKTRNQFIGIFQTTGMNLEANPMSAAHTPLADIRLIEEFQRFVRCLLLHHLWDLDPRRAKVKIVADQIGVSCMLNARLHVHTHLVGHATKGHQAFLV
jgi:hypothetical protein